MSQADQLLVERIRTGEPDAWNDLISRYEGRLIAFIEARVGRRAAAEDVVQETFIGFLTSLPNYDSSRALEGYLFSIAAHKLTDYLRREGRRPAVSLATSSSSQSDQELPGSTRPASAIARSGERRGLEEQALVEALRHRIDRWRDAGEWDKLRCAELLFVRGVANKQVAADLGISEQTVANQKYDFIAYLRTSVRSQSLSSEIFPELAEAKEN